MASSLPPGLDLSTIPISPPPPGQQSNFINPPSTSWAGRLAVYLTLPFAVVAVILRIYVRVKNGQMGADDYLLLAAAAASFSFSGVCLVTFLNDVYGRHQWDIPLSELKQSLFQQDLTSTLLYTVSAPLIKVAILALCLRLFRPSHRATVFVWVGIVVIPIYYITLIVVFLYYFVPRPGDGGWGSPKANARSLYPSGITTFIQGVGGIISDFYVLAIPVFMVLKLNLPIRRRIGVSCIFLTGLVSIAVSIAGTLYRYQSLDGPSVDFLWLITKALAVSVAELNVGLLCACMPVAFVLFQDFAQRTEAGYWRLFSYVRSRLGGSSPDITTSKGAEMENHQLDPLVRVPGESLQSCSEQALSVQSGRKDSRSQHSLG